MISNQKAEYLKGLSNADGYIDPEHVVAIATDAADLLHDEFEWDNAIAGHRHRVEQAQKLIRFVKFEIRTTRETVIAPYYVVDPKRPPKSKRYLAITVASRNQEIARMILTEELERIAAQVLRAKEVASVLGLSAELEALLENVTSLQTRAQKRAAEKKAMKPLRQKRTIRNRGQARQA